MIIFCKILKLMLKKSLLLIQKKKKKCYLYQFKSHELDPYGSENVCCVCGEEIDYLINIQKSGCDFKGNYHNECNLRWCSIW